MPYSYDEGLRPSFKPAWAKPGGISKRASPAAAPLRSSAWMEGRSGAPIRGEAERWPGAGGSRMADGSAGYAAGDGGTGGGRLPEAAGVVVFRRVAQDVEFLLLHNSRKDE